MQLKFLSLNLWQGGNLFDQIIDFIKSENPDILVLQEVYDGQEPALEKKYRSMEVLKKELNYPSSHFAPTLLDNRDVGKIEQGNAIFSKFPIKKTNVTFFDMPYRKDYQEIPENFPICPRNLQQAEIDFNGTIINIFNTQGIWGLDGGDTDRRLKMSDTIINQIKNKKNIILAGDFNVRPNTKTITNIEEHLVNVFKDELTTSFNMKQKDNPGYATAVVDMIFVSQNIKVLEHYCPQVDVSDHLPLSANLEVG